MPVGAASHRIFNPQSEIRNPNSTKKARPADSSGTGYAYSIMLLS
jgi:hypothetical protein